MVIPNPDKDESDAIAAAVPGATVVSESSHTLLEALVDVDSEQNRALYATFTLALYCKRYPLEHTRT
jgi:hypothetical protein